MCGICGFLGPPDPALLRAMTWDLRRRGPDARGLYEDPRASLGHRRLAIIDLATGDQPMTGPDGRVLVYNGELYGYRALRAELERRGAAFRTASDTEVLLQALAAWDLDALPRLEGIFAFASWEPARRRLVLARDPLGVKPLRYRRDGERLWFASETRALFRTPGFRRAVRPEALEHLLRLRYEPFGEVFADAEQVPPGHALVVEDGRARLHRYYTPPLGRRARTPGRDARELGGLLDAAVSRQLVADVPVGLFLSGGLDSAALLDAAARAGARLRTFSVGFGTPRDELAKAAALAAAYGAEHRGFVLAPVEFVRALPAVFADFDEPVLDAVQVAVWHLAREAAREVKVVLTGEGADEVLAGYVHHRALGWAALLRRLLPGAALPPLAGLVERVPQALLEPLFAYPARLGGSGRAKLGRLVRALGAPAGTYLEAATLFAPEEVRALLGPAAGRSGLEERFAALFAGAAGSRGLARALVQVDLQTWLPNNVLNRLDRLTMAHGLEGRVPYLDGELVAHALSSPWVGPPWPSKLPLRRAMRGRLAEPLRRQPKQGFYLPLDAVAGRELRELMDETLAPARLAARGLLRPGAVSGLRAAADRAGQGLLESKRLFAAFALELWLQQAVDPAPPAPPPDDLAGCRPSGTTSDAGAG